MSSLTSQPRLNTPIPEIYKILVKPVNKLDKSILSGKETLVMHPYTFEEIGLLIPTDASKEIHLVTVAKEFSRTFEDYLQPMGLKPCTYGVNYLFGLFVHSADQIPNDWTGRSFVTPNKRDDRDGYYMSHGCFPSYVGVAKHPARGIRDVYLYFVEADFTQANFICIAEPI